ncbi:amine oxidase [copper-containing] gamma 2-like [Fagus crenata]
METRSSLRFLLLFLSIALVLLFTWVHLPYAPPNTTELLDCTTNSPWCTSKNRFQSKLTNLLKKPPKPTRHHNHASDTPHHPLDPLTIQEVIEVRSILSSHALFKSSAYALHSIDLEEPEKPLVLKKASVVARVDGKSHVLTIDLSTRQVTVQETGSHTGFPTMTMEEMTAATLALLANAEFNRTIIQRGIDLKDLACLPISSGWYGKSEENMRLIKILCYSMKDTPNSYMRPIEGLTVLLDVDTKQVLEIFDKGQSIPIPKAANTDYRYSAQECLQVMNKPNPISIEQPEGPSFTIEDEHLVKWANWEFHVKPDARDGVIISRAKFQDPDTGEVRNVMYKGLQDMDAGEYGFGLQAMPLDPLNDCPRNAYYMDGVFVAADGTPYVRSNMICVFESYAGDIGWRHSESPITELEIREARPKVTLVVRKVASAANHDYIVDQEYQTDGLIRAKVSDKLV